MKIRSICTSMLLSLLAMSPLQTAAQDSCSGGDEWSWLGVDDFECSGGACSFSQVSGGPAFDFTTEPSVRRVAPSGPSDGLLQEGDVVVAVGDYLITSPIGGRTMAQLPTGEEAQLTVRRGDRLVRVGVVPESRCDPPVVRQDDISSIRPDVLGAESSATRATFELGFGLGLLCEGCAWGREESASGSAAGLLVVGVTHGGAADEAGVREGEHVLTVNGLDVQSPEGWDLFLSADVGETVTLGVLGSEGLARQVRLQKRRTTLSLDSDNLGGLWGGDDVERAERDGLLRGLLSRLGVGARRGSPGVRLAPGSSWGPGDLGLTIRSCDECSWGVEDGRFFWRFDGGLEVGAVEPGGPAAEAGVRVGDVLTHADGLDLRTVEGGDAFVNSGDRSRLVLRLVRGSQTLDVTLRLR